MADFQAKAEEVKALLQKEILNHNRPDDMSEKQLNFILEEVEEMERVRDFHRFHPSYPRGILDSWDYKDPLANQLLELFEMYRKYQ